ncbi:MAG: glycosyltransferase family 4 protein, partial [Nitrososphaerales archaeon]
MTNLSGRGHDVQLLTRRFKNTSKVERWNGLRVSRIGPAKKSSISRIILFMNQIVAGGLIIRRSRTDLIHTNSFISLYAALVLGRLFRIPTVMTFNGSQRIWRPEARWQSNADLSITLPLESYAMKQADAIFVQSQELKSVIEQLYGVKGRMVKVIPHPVDLDIFKPRSDRKNETSNIILFVGTLGRIHGADLFVRSIDPVLKEFSNAKFIIVGTG